VDEDKAEEEAMRLSKLIYDATQAPLNEIDCDELTRKESKADPFIIYLGFRH
jgi:hypothetical protein